MTLQPDLSPLVDSRPPTLSSSLFDWSVPFLCWMAVILTVLAGLTMYFIPLRYIILAWGESPIHVHICQTDVHVSRLTELWSHSHSSILHCVMLWYRYQQVYKVSPQPKPHRQQRAAGLPVQVTHRPAAGSDFLPSHMHPITSSSPHNDPSSHHILPSPPLPSAAVARVSCTCEVQY